ncbi:MAG: asparagine synthase (glutamine-hydrolyzing) [Betaproteobacteria bacterium]|nr:asparagine synthase (glutamine-hydrolyzing) [Betaproteobacteria bacterium]
MCGIAGILSRPRGQPPQARELSAMIGRLAHRGPDGNGIHLDGPAGLAHARLAIIDLAGGAQPLANETGSVWVTFNGEIFNFVELRADLVARGHAFRTQSDTEVIVHLYEDHGERFVEHLNGQFAIAVWDRERERLVLARDRAGIRPLFWTEAADRFLFASEAKALFALPEVPRRLDRRSLAQACTFWSALPPGTAFEGVQSLPPGHVMVVTAEGRRLERYWDWTFPSAHEAAPADDRPLADALRELLIDATRLQLRADVPVGAYLSGGLDSAIVATIVRRFTGAPLRTFSLTFEDEEFDESGFQREMVAFLGTDHTSIRCTRADIAAAFPRAVFHAEAPIVRTAPTPLMLLAGHVRAEGYKVVLTGEGADEVFGGYDIFKEAKVRRFWARSPGSASRPRILERLYPYLRHSPAAGRAFTQAFFKEGLEHANEPWFAHAPRWTTTRRIHQFFSPALRESLAGWDPYAEIAGRIPAAAAGWVPMGRDQYVEAHTLMSGYLLCSQGDRVAMAHSIEGRFPFLDHRVIEFANRLPPQLKLHGLQEKYLLKKSMAGLLPESIRARTKQPYRAPDSQSFFVAGRPVDYVADLLSPARLADAGHFDPVAVGKLVAKCAAGRAIGFADNMAFVAILSTMLLEEQFVRGGEGGKGAPACAPGLLAA